MRRTTFKSEVHGFAFTNFWKFEEAERLHIQDVFIAYVTRRRILGPIGALLAPPIVRLLRGQLERHLSPHYGLCGGMCFAALDYYLHGGGLSLPRGQHANDQPAPGTGLRRYIWERQLDSLVSDAVKFLAWLVILNYVPSVWPFRGGARWLLARSKREWGKLRASMDAGKPVVIGLTRVTKRVYDNHQVLAIGYSEVDETRVMITVYDPNCPDSESTIDIVFEEQQLNGRESCGGDAPLRGFFCESYSPFDPRETVGVNGSATDTAVSDSGGMVA
jgi:hypothetical protein